MISFRAFVLITGLIFAFAAGAHAQTEELRDLQSQVKALYKQGELEKAVPLAERAIVLAEQEFGADHPTTAVMVDNLGILYTDLGQHAAAEKQHWQAVAILQKEIAKSPHSINQSNGDAALYRGRALYNRARMAAARQDYENAILLYEVVGSIFEIHMGKTHEDVAVVLDYRAEALRAAGHTEEADAIEHRARILRK